VHEYSIVASLVDRVEREVAIHQGARVRRLHVAIGELAGVEIELLRTAWDTFTGRSACEGAELDVRPVAASWECPRCGLAIDRGQILRCPTCARPAHLARGDEIILERIEMEVPDV
jgi:hydrogenase nickel incorporation protein HypA/HybF